MDLLKQFLRYHGSYSKRSSLQTVYGASYHNVMVPWLFCITFINFYHLQNVWKMVCQTVPAGIGRTLIVLLEKNIFRLVGLYQFCRQLHLISVESVNEWNHRKHYVKYCSCLQVAGSFRMPSIYTTPWLGQLKNFTDLENSMGTQ